MHRPQSSDCDDMEPKIWFPHSLKAILDIEKMTISELKSLKSTDSLHSRFLETGEIGLTAIEVNQESVVVCFTTADKVYVARSWINEENEIAQTALRNKKGVQFLTANGSIDAYLIKRFFGVRVRSTIDLVSFDIHLWVQQAMMNDKMPPKTYGAKHIMEKMKPPQNDFRKLVKKWLDPGLDIVIDPLEMGSLFTDPLDVTAKNIIIKRAALVRVLGLKMYEKFYETRRRPGLNLLTMAHVSDDAMDAYIKSDDNSYLGVCGIIKSISLQEDEG